MIAGTAFRIVDARHAWGTIYARTVRTRSDPWTCEEIAELCERGDAVCLSCPDGVVVIKLIGSERVGLEAEVVLGVSSGKPGAYERTEDELMAVLRDMGVRSVFFRTDRVGWLRMLGPEWRQLGNDLYERSV